MFQSLSLLFSQKEESRKGPNSESVNKATAGLTPCNMEPTTDKPLNGGDVRLFAFLLYYLLCQNIDAVIKP